MIAVLLVESKSDLTVSVVDELIVVDSGSQHANLVKQQTWVSKHLLFNDNHILIITHLNHLNSYVMFRQFVGLKFRFGQL